VMCVCVLSVDFFQDDLRCLFSPHQVNHGGVQKDSTDLDFSLTDLSPVSSEVVLTLLSWTPSPVFVFSSRLPIYTSSFFGT
jgi:hypothetical protein